MIATLWAFMRDPRTSKIPATDRAPGYDGRRATFLRAWRWVLVLYALALTTATHWPRLQLAGEMPGSDKIAHLFAFGGLTALLWRSGWLRRDWLVALVALVWAGIDELTQGIPALHRTVSIYDMMANIGGVVCAMALIGALRLARRAGSGDDWRGP